MRKRTPIVPPAQVVSCPAPYRPAHKFCEWCHGTGVVSAELLATLEPRPFAASIDDGGKVLYPAGVEWQVREVTP